MVSVDDSRARAQAFALPHTAAAAVPALDDDVDDDAHAHAAGRARAHLALTATAIAVGLVVACTAVSAQIAEQHALDKALWNRWWSHHISYECCVLADARCNEGAAALTRLRARLANRPATGALETALATLLDTDSLALTEPPTTLAEVDHIFATCPRLPR